MYLEDVIFFLKNVESHFKEVEQIFHTTSYYGISLKINKCEFLMTYIKYLGQIFKPAQLRISDEKTKRLMLKKTIIRTREFRSF